MSRLLLCALCALCAVTVTAQSNPVQTTAGPATGLQPPAQCPIFDFATNVVNDGVGGWIVEFNAQTSKTLEFVIVHYRSDPSSDWINQQMRPQSNSQWSFPLDIDLFAGDTLQFWFTYCANGVDCDSPQFAFAVPQPQPAPLMAPQPQLSAPPTGSASPYSQATSFPMSTYGQQQQQQAPFSMYGQQQQQAPFSAYGQQQQQQALPPMSAYGQQTAFPMGGYGQGATSFPAAAGGYDQGATSLPAGAGGYGQGATAFPAAAGGYGQGATDLSAAAGGYGQGPADFAAGGYGQPTVAAAPLGPGLSPAFVVAGRNGKWGRKRSGGGGYGGADYVASGPVVGVPIGPTTVWQSAPVVIPDDGSDYGHGWGKRGRGGYGGSVIAAVPAVAAIPSAAPYGGGYGGDVGVASAGAYGGPGPAAAGPYGGGAGVASAGYGR